MKAFYIFSLNGGDFHFTSMVAILHCIHLDRRQGFQTNGSILKGICCENMAPPGMGHCFGGKSAYQQRHPVLCFNATVMLGYIAPNVNRPSGEQAA